MCLDLVFHLVTFEPLCVWILFFTWLRLNPYVFRSCFSLGYVLTSMCLDLVFHLDTFEPLCVWILFFTWLRSLLNVMCPELRSSF